MSAKDLKLAKERVAVEAQQVKLEQKSQQLGDAVLGQRADDISLGSFKKRIGRATQGVTGQRKLDASTFENLALGAGFPLLFGGGPGTVAGGVLGSFVGKGFGGQILGGALGQIFDDLIISLSDLSKAVEKTTSDFSELRAAGINVTNERGQEIRDARRGLDFDRADALLDQTLTENTGDLGGIGTAGVAAVTQDLVNSWNELRNAVSLTVGIIAAPFISGLAKSVRLVAQIFKFVNLSVTAVGNIIRGIPGVNSLFEHMEGAARGYERKLSGQY